MTEHRFADIVQRPLALIFLLLVMIYLHIYTIRLMDVAIAVYADDVHMREKDLSVATPSIDTMNEAIRPR